MKFALCGTGCFFLAVIVMFGAAVNKTVNAPSATVSWTSTCPTCTYKLYRGTAAGVCPTAATPFKAGLAANNFIDNAVTPGTTYFYAMRATDPATTYDSGCSNEASKLIPKIPDAPVVSVK